MPSTNKPPKSANRARYLKQRAQSHALISGTGIFFTCTRGKEIPAGSELSNLLQSIADEFDLNSNNNQDEPMEEEEEEEDIESMIHKELEEIKSTSKQSNSNSLAQRFNYKKTDCECLGFIQFPKGRNPIQFINHMIAQIQSGTTGYGLRYIQRLTPVTSTCPSSSLPAFKTLVKRILKPHFGTTRSPTSSQESPRAFGLQYRIEPIIRCHDQPLTRTEVIKSIGEIVEEFNHDTYLGPPNASDLEDSRVPFKHKVNLNHAKVVILVSVYRYVAGISVVSDYDQDRKRFNLQAIAEAREKTQIETSPPISIQVPVTETDHPVHLSS